MAISFTDVSLKLDELVEMEAGVLCERLCVALARRKYPGLVATESKKDSGQDAVFAGEPLAGLGVPGVAVSITSTIGKVKADARAIRESGTKVDTLVFYTPRKVSNTTAQKWAGDVETEFGHKLLVISREDIIHSLLEPDNAFIAERYLSIDVERPQNLNGIIPGALRAARQIADQWIDAPLVTPDQLISLSAYKLDSSGDRLGNIVDIDDLKFLLTDSERLLLLGGAGAGKSTTLAMVATSMLDEANELIPLLVSIPELLDSRKQIMDYVADQPSFRALRISASDLVLIAERGHIAFLLNGWNEVGGADSARASREFRKLVREYPSAGVLASSRPQKIDPFGGGSLRFELAGVSDSQRETYLQGMLPERWNVFLQQVEGSAALDSLSRSPFILEQLVKLYVTNGTFPSTRAEVLESIISATEKLPEHAPTLEADPIQGFSGQYLVALAAEMTLLGRVSLSRDDACRIVSHVSELQIQKGQRAGAPAPLSILGGLCAHHLLEGFEYPEPAYRFSHQQFQESFGASSLQTRVEGALEDEDTELVAKLQSEVFDIPVWEGSLFLFAEKQGVRGGDKAASIVRALVEWAVKVDPVTAARIYGVSGQIAETALTNVLEPNLRRWYKSSSSAHRACAVSAMVATGSDRFSDILWGLLEYANRDVRIAAFDTVGPFNLCVLGGEWRTRVRDWPSERRIEFIDTIGYSGSRDGVDLAGHFAGSDPDVDVRLKALDVLRFEGTKAKLIEALEVVDDETIRKLVARGQLPEDLPPELVARQAKALATLISESEDAKVRIELAAKALRAGNTMCLDQIKSDLDRLDMSGLDYQFERYLYDVVRQIFTYDEPWTLRWVQSRILSEELGLGEWVPLVRLSDSSAYDPLLDDLANPNSRAPRARHGNELLAAIMDSRQIERLLGTFLRAHRELVRAPNPQPKGLRNAYWRVRDLLRDLPITALVAAVCRRLAEAEDDREVWELLDLLGVSQVADFEDDAVREEMDQDVLEQLRQRLRELVPVVDSAEDVEGWLIMRLGCAIGRFGHEKDALLLQQLIRKDIERVQLGCQLLRSGNQQDPRAGGSRTRHGNWLVGALLGLAGQGCDKFLMELMQESEYENEAAHALHSLVWIPLERTSLFRDSARDYEMAAELRVEPRKHFCNEGERKLYADAVKQILLDVIADGKGNSGDSSLRLKLLASNLSLFSREEDVQIILEQLSLEGKCDACVVLDVIERLVFAGIGINAVEVKKALDPVVKSIVDGEDWYQPDQQGLLLRRCVSILLFSDEPDKGVELLTSLYPNKLRQRDLNEIIDTVGRSQSEEAAKWLMSLLEDDSLENRLAARILAVLVRLGGETYEDAFLALLGLSDATLIRIDIRRETIDPCALAIAQRAAIDAVTMQKLVEKCSEELGPQQLAILTSVINMAKDPTLDTAALQLLRDGETIPWLVVQITKRAFYEEVPIPGSEGTFNVSPIPNSVVRANLLEMIYGDERRKNSAYELLGEIDQWRLKSGKPNFEPRHPNISSGYAWPVVETEIC